jgi:hypothetical protein
MHKTGSRTKSINTVVVILESAQTFYGFENTRVVSVCEDWSTAEKEKARLRSLAGMSKYYLIEKTVLRGEER